MPDNEMFDAIRRAHQAAECRDYYCGCWDNGSKWEMRDEERFGISPWRHTTKFLASLREQGYDIVRVREEGPQP